jgi:crotonobetainyl-CoA:carnitine CoA-transferase CaiB-like acyl-CoA transferase
MTRDTGDYAGHLLASLGRRAVGSATTAGPHPAVAWAGSGAMDLTGPADGPPVLGPAGLASCAQGAIEALAVLAEDRWRMAVDGAALLGERAAILGLRRRGTVSPGGACRLLRSATGWIAVNLPRDDDLATLPAWLEEPVRGDPWDFVTDRVAGRGARPLVARARLLGLAAAEATPPTRRARPWCRVERAGTPVRRPAGATPLVLDLSSLWAGPLATHLLALAGARVVKLESVHRPDGARRGAPTFFDLLNADKASVALDFRSAADRARLHALIASSDIVVESARPRALAQLGFDARAVVAKVPGLTWVSITGYGRVGRGANWIAFGDDAGVAAGLATATGADTPLFCADAIADPLAGMHAAVAAMAVWRDGGGRLIDIALRDVAAHALGFASSRRHAPASVRERPGAGWEVVADGTRQVVAPPRARPAAAMARPLGTDTDALLGRLTRGANPLLAGVRLG